MNAELARRRLGARSLMGRVRERLSSRLGPAPAPGAAPIGRNGLTAAAPAASRNPDAIPATASGTGGLAGATFSASDLIGLRARAAGLSLEPNRIGPGGRAGTRAARLRGRGMEYAESRVYIPGDDIRSIDWRVTARTGRVHTKLFDQERDRPILFVVDLGEHMRFATRRAFKSVVAAEAASLLAWAAVANGDRVGGLVVAGSHAAESRIGRGRRGALALFRVLAGVENATRGRGAGASIRDALRRVHRVARPGTLVVLISDFSGRGDPTGSELVRLRRHSDLVCVWIHDELESRPPPPARYPIGDGRRAAILDTRSLEVARAIEHRFDGIESWITSACRRAGALLVRIRCGDDVRGVLRGTFAGHAARHGASS